MVTTSQILGNSYDVAGCCDFFDIAQSLHTILDNCRFYKVNWWDYKSVTKRVLGMYKKYKNMPEKFAKTKDIEKFKEYYPEKFSIVHEFLCEK